MRSLQRQFFTNVCTLSLWNKSAKLSQSMLSRPRWAKISWKSQSLAERPLAVAEGWAEPSYLWLSSMGWARRPADRMPEFCIEDFTKSILFIFILFLKMKRILPRLILEFYSFFLKKNRNKTQKWSHQTWFDLVWIFF